MRRRLYRSRTDRMLFGVAGGMAEWLDVDAAVVRIVWALLVLAGGAGFLLYIVAAIVIPEEPFGYVAGVPAGPPSAGDAAAAGAGTTPAPNTWTAGQRVHREGGGAIVFGACLVIVGAWFLVRNYIPAFDDRFVLPSVLVVIGIFLIAGAMRRR
ncbi:MAG TPA: PspC domain-containing protein [Candidatus Limnocylindrales bacterium]|nr:PspC domain-containing protein [Candidatus Limnocylindrales bacterium]